MSLPRRKRLARGKPLERSQSRLKRRVTIRSRSERTTQEAPLRAEIRATVLHRDSYRCQLRGNGPCWGPLDVHEVVRRSQHPGSHLIEELCITLCRRHHDLDESRFVAEGLGIRVPDWEYEQRGEMALAEAAALRGCWRTGITPPPPSWWPETG